MIFIISGPAGGVDMYFDKIEVSNFARDRSWKPASDLRIDELRKNDVTFKASSYDLILSLFYLHYSVKVDGPASYRHKVNDL